MALTGVELQLLQARQTADVGKSIRAGQAPGFSQLPHSRCGLAVIPQDAPAPPASLPAGTLLKGWSIPVLVPCTRDAASPVLVPCSHPACHTPASLEMMTSLLMGCLGGSL